MIRMHLRAADLAETRFAISPLQETVFSLWVWRRPERQPFHLPWRRLMQPRWHAIDHEILTAMMSPATGWLPDFLTPRPVGPVTEFAEELATVAATPWRRVRPDLEAAYAEVPLPSVLRTTRPARLRERIVAALAAYHEACIAPFWPRMRAVLEGDIAYRARQLAEAGAAGLFGGLDSRVRWNDGYLYVERLHVTYDLEIGGRGLPLVPSLFARHAVTYIDQDEPPAITYPARGQGAVWEWATPPARAALTDLLGPARARLLTVLAQPATTTELAQRIGVSPSAVSQHLRVLHDARLLTRSRSGRAVIYLRSELADALVDG